MAHEQPRTTEAPSTKPVRRKSDITRERILVAAATVFRTRGYSGTRLTEIAEMANMQVGSLYYHFRSREALVAEVMAMGLEQTVEAYRAALADLPPEADYPTRIRTAVEAHVLQLLQPGAFPGAMFKLTAEVPPDLREVHRAGERAYGHMWRDLLAEAQAAGVLRDGTDASVLRMLIVGAMNWTLEWFRPEKGDAEHVASQCADFVLHGILRAEAAT